MKKIFLFCVALFFLSCATMPKIQPLSDTSLKCPSPFPTEKTRLIHTLDVRVGGQARAVLIGVTLVDPDRRTLSAAVVSPEGMVLLEASCGPNGLVVDRAVPPFDSVDFTRSMMDDMRLIFLAPEEATVQKGRLPDGNAVCRRPNAAGGWVDVVFIRDGHFRIVRYSRSGRPDRSVALSGERTSPYLRVKLQGSGTFDYALNMTLIESENLKKNSPATEEVEKIRP